MWKVSPPGTTADHDDRTLARSSGWTASSQPSPSSASSARPQKSSHARFLNTQVVRSRRPEQQRHPVGEAPERDVWAQQFGQWQGRCHKFVIFPRPYKYRAYLDWGSERASGEVEAPAGWPLSSDEFGDTGAAKYQTRGRRISMSPDLSQRLSELGTWTGVDQWAGKSYPLATVLVVDDIEGRNPRGCSNASWPAMVIACCLRTTASKAVTRRAPRSTRSWC